jgi:hypothetical protein
MTSGFAEWRRRLPDWARPRDEQEAAEERAILGRILFAMVWLPIQLTLSLFLAAGGMFLLLVLGLVLGPFVGLFLLIRRLVRRPSPGLEGRPAPEA